MQSWILTKSDMNKPARLFPIYATTLGMRISPKWSEVVRYNVVALWLMAAANIFIIVLTAGSTVVLARVGLDLGLWGKEGNYPYMAFLPLMIIALAFVAFWLIRDLVKLTRYLVSGREKPWT
jgi:H+/Cl- antiporter ClcA